MGGAQRRPGVVGDLPRPHEVPESHAQGLCGGVQLGQQVGEEAGPLCQAGAQELVLGAARRRCASARGAPGTAGRSTVRRHGSRSRPARSARRGPGPDPHELAARAEAVEPGLRVGAGATREHVALPDLDRQRQTLQPRQHLPQPVDPCAGRGVAVDSLPGGQEGRERAPVGGLDLLAQGRQGGPAERRRTSTSHHRGRCRPAKLAADRAARALELAQDRARVDAVAVAQLLVVNGPCVRA